MMNNQNNISDYLSALSERHWIENNVSDFLYALLKSSDNFFNIFIKIIISKESIYSSIKFDKSLIKREHRYRNKLDRADLLIPLDGLENASDQIKPLLVEVKVTDHNYHTKKYNSDSVRKKYQICLIDKIKHDNTKKFEGWILITWDEVIERLHNSNNKLVKDFSSFFKKVLKLEEIKKIKLDPLQLQSTAYFSRMARRAINNLKNGKYNGCDFQETTWGHYFTYKTSTKKNIKIWFGLNFTNENERRINAALFVERKNNDKIYNNVNFLLKKQKLPKKFELKFNSEEIILFDKTFLSSLNKQQTKELQIKFITDRLQRILKLFDRL